MQPTSSKWIRSILLNLLILNFFITTKSFLSLRWTNCIFIVWFSLILHHNNFLLIIERHFFLLFDGWLLLIYLPDSIEINLFSWCGLHFYTWCYCNFLTWCYGLLCRELSFILWRERSWSDFFKLLILFDVFLQFFCNLLKVLSQLVMLGLQRLIITVEFIVLSSHIRCFLQ